MHTPISTLVQILATHSSAYAFVSVKGHFVVSEQWSIPVSKDFLWEVTAISTPQCWAACGLSVWRSGCLPLSRKKTFPLRQKIDKQCCQKPELPTSRLNSTRTANTGHSGVVLTAEVKGHLRVPLDLDSGQGFLFSSSSSSSCVLLVSSSVPPSVWCQGF